MGNLNRLLLSSMLIYCTSTNSHRSSFSTAVSYSSPYAKRSTDSLNMIRKFSFSRLRVGRFQRRSDSIVEDLAKHEEQIDKKADSYNIADARNMQQSPEARRQDSLTQITEDKRSTLPSNYKLFSVIEEQQIRSDTYP